MLTLNVAAQTTDPIPTVTIGSGTETSGDFPTYAYCDYSYTQQLYTASELSPVERRAFISFIIRISSPRLTLIASLTRFI